jgi:GNAT superfamily N-acetyltransferase
MDKGAQETSPESRINIRQIAVDDWQAYEQIRHEMLRADPDAFPPQAFQDLSDPEQKWRERIETGDVILAYDGHKPVGMVRVTYNGETAVLRNMYTNSEYRGQGLGKKLMETAVGKMYQRGAKVAELEVEDTQIPAKTMYEKVLKEKGL